MAVQFSWGKTLDHIFFLTSILYLTKAFKLKSQDFVKFILWQGNGSRSQRLGLGKALFPPSLPGKGHQKQFTLTWQGQQDTLMIFPRAMVPVLPLVIIQPKGAFLTYLSLRTPFVCYTEEIMSSEWRHDNYVRDVNETHALRGWKINPVRTQAPT